ncbi:sugar ABC transporter permease [Spirochaetia bacterium]|nr:sugar ABC transporter permease [Spirochaetia bacterium]
MKRSNVQAYTFLSPFLAFVLILYLLPAVLTVVMAFTSLNSSFVWKFNGPDNFLRMMKDPNTGIIARNTVLYVSITILFTLALDLALAILTTYFIRSERISEIFKAILMIPMVTPAVVYSVLWIWLLDASPNGLVNKIYQRLWGGGALNWIALQPFTVTVIATLVSSIAYGTIVFSSAIKSIPENQFKAARVDGAKELSIIFNIIVPNLRYHITFIALWETLGLLTNYVTILLITNGGPGIRSEVWALSAYHKAFVDRQYGYGSAISLVLIAVVTVLMLAIGAVTAAQNKES